MGETDKMLGLLAVFGFGILVGGILFNKDLRQKFQRNLDKYRLGRKGSKQSRPPIHTDYRKQPPPKIHTDYTPPPRQNINVNINPPDPNKPRPITCPRCKGTGLITKRGWLGTSSETCPNCEGSKVIYV